MVYTRQGVETNETTETSNLRTELASGLAATAVREGLILKARVNTLMAENAELRDENKVLRDMLDKIRKLSAGYVDVIA